MEDAKREFLWRKWAVYCAPTLTLTWFGEKVRERFLLISRQVRVFKGTLRGPGCSPLANQKGGIAKQSILWKPDTLVGNQHDAIVANSLYGLKRGLR